MDDLGLVRGFDSLALLQVEDGVVAQQNRFAIFRFSCLLVLLSIFVNLPEDNLGPVLALLDASAQCLGLTIGNPVARAVTLREARRKILMPRYSFLLTRFAGGSVRQGLRQGATPDSSCLMMDSVTISYAVGICVVLLLVWISFD
jgi:hypothetical protein